MLNIFNGSIAAAVAFIASKPRLNLRKRKVQVVFKSMWLHGTYMVTVQRGDDLNAAICDRIIEVVPGEVNHATIKAIRSNPGHEIIEVW